MTSIRTKKINAGEHVINVLEAGEPQVGLPTLMFLHGSGPGVTARSNWSLALSDLGSDFHCVAPDVLGFGDSSHPDPAPQGVVAFTEARIESLFCLLDELHLSDVVLIGNSMGCVYSLEMAARDSSRISKLVLMGAGNIEDQPKMPGIENLVTFYDAPSIDALEDLSRLFVYDPFSWDGRLREIASERYSLAMREDIRRSHLATFQPGPRKFHTSDFLQRVKQPALLIHGQDDRVVSPYASQFIAEHLPIAHLVLLGQCGHWAQLEYPHLFAAMVRGFVKSENR